MSKNGKDSAAGVPASSDAATRVEEFAESADLSWVVALLSDHRDEILSRWLDVATDQPFHERRSERAVADHIPTLFDALVQLLARDAEQNRDPGAPLDDPGVLAAAENHARVRFRQGFSAPDVATEFRLLRQEIGRALRLYVADRSPTSDVVGAELLLHDALDGAVFLALTALNAHEDERRRTEAALRESEERFRLLVERVEDYAIYTLTPDGTVASWNVGAERILGFGADEILGRPFASIFSPEDAARRAPEDLLVKVAAAGRVQAEGQRRRADGAHLMVEHVLTALHDDDGALIGFAEVLRDMSERQRLEREREVAEREREAFLATLGHDLKSPLAKATAIAQLLRYNAGRGRVEASELGDKLSGLEAALRRVVLRVHELIDLLGRDQATPTALNLEELDLVALVREVVGHYESTSARHQFVLQSVPENLPATCDRDRLERAIDNLVGNAVKFSPRGGKISITIAAETVGDRSWALIRIVDEGLGIPEEEIATVFGRFRRATNVKEVSGSGLGLWSVRRIVEQHGGSIAATSRLGAGSEFTLRLPLRRRSTSGSTPSGAAEATT